MNKLATIAPKAPSVWRAQPGESDVEHLKFLHWALQDGELDTELAARHQWTERRNVIESYEALLEITPGEQALEAAIAQASVLFVEASKLRARVLQDPDNVLTPSEILKGVEWMTEKSLDYARRRADSMDWGSLLPEEREIMLQAKRIQDRLMGKE